jgi:hypothetical protein
MLNLNIVRLAVPQYKNDKIIGVLTGSISVAGAVSPAVSVVATASPDTGFGDWCLFAGVFSIDGGATWNDTGSQTPELSVPGAPVFDTFDCTVTCSPTGVFTVTCTNYVNPNTGSTSAKTALYKILLLAKKDQGTINPLPTNALPLYHSSKFNYQKIYLDDSGRFTTVAGNTGQLIVPHNLGYIPNVRAWENAAGTIRQVLFQPEIKLTNTDVTFFYDGFFEFTNRTFNIIYRIYLDG